MLNTNQWPESTIPKRAVDSAARLLIEPGKKLFITGGVGDFFTLESFLTTKEIESVTVVYQMGYRPPSVEPLAEIVFPNLKHYCYFWHCLDSKNATWSLQGTLARKMKAVDPSICILPCNVLFSAIKSNCRQFQGSIFLSNKMAAVDNLQLPLEYAFINPHTVNATGAWSFRTFEKTEWGHVIRYLQQENLKGVVVGLDCLNIPQDDSLIDLNNSTTLLEAIEILKGSKAYVGIDSAFSVLAAQLFPKEQLYVRSRSSWCYQNLPVYFAPHTDFSFVTKSLESLSLLGDGNHNLTIL